MHSQRHSVKLCAVCVVLRSEKPKLIIVDPLLQAARAGEKRRHEAPAQSVTRKRKKRVAVDTFAQNPESVVVDPLHDEFAKEREILREKERIKRGNGDGMWRPHARRTPPNKVFCGICNKGFPFAGSMRVHMRIHTGERPCVCEICGKGFTHVGNLNRHRRSHAAQLERLEKRHDAKFVKVYACGVCGRQFGTVGVLARHKRQAGHALSEEVVDERECDACGRWYHSEKALKMHQYKCRKKKKHAT